MTASTKKVPEPANNYQRFTEGEKQFGLYAGDYQDNNGIREISRLIKEIIGQHSDSLLNSSPAALELIKELKINLNDLESKAIENQQLPGEEILQTKELESLLNCAKLVLEGNNFNLTARRIFDATREMTGAPSGYVALLSPDKKKNKVIFLESGGRPCDVDPALPMPIRGLRAEAYKLGGAVYENDFINSQWAKFLPEGHVKLRNVLFAPLNVEGEVTGIMGLANKSGGFSEYDRRIGEALADLLAIALKNNRNLEALQKSEQKFRRLIDNTIDWVWQIDEKGRYNYASPSAINNIGYTPEDLCQMTFFDLLGSEKESNSEIFAYIQKCMPIVSLEIQMTHKKGSKVYFEVNATPIQSDDGFHQGYFGTCRDITERKQADEQLRNSHQELEKRVAERTAELEQQRLISMRTDRLRSLGEMAAGIAHELNQPLVGVRGLAEHMLLAKKRGWTMDSEQAEKKLEKIIQQADRMSQIIQHVRTFSKEAGKPDLYPVCINEVIEAALSLLETQLLSRGIVIQLSLRNSPPCVIANPFSLEEVILNCLTNARDAIEDLSMGPEEVNVKNFISLTTYVEEKGEQRVILEIKDSGKGIPADLLDLVYQPFFTTKGPDRGSGLGLSISKSIVESFGGVIDLKTKEGKGSQVIISLPSK